MPIEGAKPIGLTTRICRFVYRFGLAKAKAPLKIRDAPAPFLFQLKGYWPLAASVIPLTSAWTEVSTLFKLASMDEVSA